MMSGSVFLRQLFPEDFQQLLVWYKIRDALVGQNLVEQNIKKALEFASVCEHPNAVWLTNLFDGRDVALLKRQEKFFFAVKKIRELFALLVGLFGIVRKFLKLLFLAMLSRKLWWQGKQMTESVLDGRKNLLLKGNVMGSIRTLLTNWNWMRQRC
jgi:hypothetical protein